MPDNVLISAQVDNESAQATVAADEIGGAQYQRVKLIHGADGANDGDVSSANPLPVVPSARSATADTITAKLATDKIQDGLTALTPKFAKIAASGSGNNTIVAAVTSKKIRVLAYNFMSEGTVNAKFQSAAGGTDLTGLSYLIANTGKVAPFNPVGWFETVAGELLNLNLSAAVAVGGELVYVEV